MNLIANGKSDHYSECAEQIKPMTSIEPTSLEHLNWLLHLQHVRGEIASCKMLIKENIEKTHGKNEYAYFKEGTILREEGKLQEALEAFQICHKLNAGNTEHVKEIAKCLYLLQRYRLALEAYLEAEKASVKPDWEIFHNIGQCLILMGKSSKAREYVQKAVQYGKQEESYSLLIKILLEEGDQRSAIAVCNAALDACPDSVEMLTQSGLLYLKAGQTQLAFEKLSSALALEPLSAKALLGIGCITQFHEEYDVALTKYKLAVQSQPDSVALWNNIGMCFFSKQKYVAAITCLKKALWLSPLNSRVLLNLGMVHLSTHQPASAFNFLCGAANLRPDLPLVFTILGCSLMALGDHESALRAMRQALTLSPEQPLIQLNTSVLLYHNAIFDDARQLLDTFGQNRQNLPLNEEWIILADRLSTALNSMEHRKAIAGTTEDYEDEPIYAEIGDVKNEETKVECDRVFGSGIEPLARSLSVAELGPDEVSSDGVIAISS